MNATIHANAKHRLPACLLAALLAAAVAAVPAVPARAEDAPAFVNGARVDGAEPGEWTHDWNAAAAAAERTGMPVFVLFTGSDWCPWCKVLERQVFSQDEWSAWARENAFLVRVDSPRDDSLVPEKHRVRNRELQRRYGIGGYPTCLLLDPSTLSPIGRFGASRDVTAADFIRRVAAAIRGEEAPAPAPASAPAPAARPAAAPAALKEPPRKPSLSFAKPDPETVTAPKADTVCLDEWARARTKFVTIPEGVRTLSRKSGGYIPGALLERVSLPASLETIRPTAFDGHWRHLSRIDIAEGSPYRMEDGCLIDSRNDAVVFSLPGRRTVQVPSSAKAIGDRAFNANDAAEIALPEGVATIGRGAFGDCRDLERLSIPASVAEIGDDAFAHCGKLEHVTVADGNPRYAVRDGLLLDKETGTLLRAFGPLVRVVVPDEVRTIGESAFSFQKTLVSVVVPPTVARIGDNAFAYCTNLEELQLPERLDSYGEHFVMGCESLRKIRLPAGLDRLSGMFSIGRCSSLRELALPEGLRTIDAYGLGAVCECAALECIILPASVERIASGRAFLKNPALQAFEVHPENPAFRSVDGVLFSRDMTRLVRCPEAKSGAYAIPDTVTRIDDSAFAGCRRLESIHVPDGVESAGRDAFLDCPAILSRPVPEAS